MAYLGGKTRWCLPARRDLVRIVSHWFAHLVSIFVYGTGGRKWYATYWIVGFAYKRVKRRYYTFRMVLELANSVTFLRFAEVCSFLSYMIFRKPRFPLSHQQFTDVHVCEHFTISIWLFLHITCIKVCAQIPRTVLEFKYGIDLSKPKLDYVVNCESETEDQPPTPHELLAAHACEQKSFLILRYPWNDLSCSTGLHLAVQLYIYI